MQIKIENEKELIQKAQAGDINSFEELIYFCADDIFLLSYRLTGDNTEAQDITQETFINAFRYITKFRNECSFSNWLYKIALNIWKNRVRYQKKRYFLKHYSLEEAVSSTNNINFYDIVDNKDDPVVDVEKKEREEELNTLLQALNVEDRLVIVLRDIQNKSYEEISDILKCPLGTVKSRLARAREELRKKYVELLKGK